MSTQEKIDALREALLAPTSWATAALAIIDEQAAEIERLRAEHNRISLGNWDAYTRAVAENERLRARVASLEESLHLANGVADLAMKHRDAAEKQLAAAIMKAHAEATDEFLAVDAGPTPLRGRVTRREG